MSNWPNFTTIIITIITTIIDGTAGRASLWCHPDGTITIITIIFTIIIIIITFTEMTIKRKASKRGQSRPLSPRGASLISRLVLGGPMQMTISAVKHGIG